MSGKTEYDSNKLGRPFGQHEPLTVRLHGLIRNYPKGVGIFQEFIQNADDAGASWVKIILDRRTFYGDRLPSPAMQDLMGPAMMVFNDQVFSDEDLESIQKIGMGSKSQSSSKTGRFGLGFNACYNVTDYPSFLTREGIFFFDPHCKTVEGAEPNTPGRAWDLTSDAWNEYPDLFHPFEILGLEPGQLGFSGTIFRLPLRSQKQAAGSKISREPFLEKDFEQLLNQFIPLGAEMLIFLKHVTHITVYEIPADKNQLVELLDIKTSNEVEVREKRGIVNEYVRDDPGQMIGVLRSNKVEPPLVSFLHEIELHTPIFKERQTWRVVSGLYIDEKRKIVDLVEEMYRIEEKAVPWVGAAARLKVERIGEDAHVMSEFQGKVFCFLPLHIQTRLPVHLNGFFDLDSSRQTLTTDHQTLSGKDAIRAEWNTQLVNLCVGRVYAMLISDLVQDVGYSDIKSFYKYWPDPRIDLPGALEGLPTAVYQNLQYCQVLHSADPDQEWCDIHSLFLIPDAWQSQLQFPLAADAMLIPKPKLPPHIAQGYKLAGIACNTVTPTLIRSRLKVTEDIDKPLDKVDRRCLSQRKWVVDLLRFCLQDKPTSDLIGVPLAILSDGHLHTFGLFRSNWAFLATEIERKIFSNFPGWFIDLKFADECELEPIDDAKLRRMTPGNVIVNLSNVLNFPGTESPATWNPKAGSHPNNNWLTLVYEYLSSHMSEVLQSEGDLKKIFMVPDQFNQLWKFSLDTTPLIPPEDISSELRTALTKINFPIVTGTSKLMSAIREFQKKASGKFLWGFTGRDFTDTLASFAEKWQEKYPTYVPDIHNPILDFLSTPAVLESLEQNEDRITKLKGLLIYPTINGALTRASEPELYLPANYDPPAGAGSLRLLDIGPDGRWKPLLRLLKIEELDRPTLIQKILLPGYEAVSPTAQINILEWIRDNLNLAETEQQKKNSNDKIVDLVANASLILCTDGAYYPCRSIYDPRHEQPIRAVLGSDAKFPNLDVYRDQERWLKFFHEDLGMANAPRASAILGAIDKLIVESIEKDVSSVRDRLLSIFNYIVTTDNWNRILGERIDDSEPGILLALFTDLLRERKWLPAQCDPKQLKRYAAYKIPDDRLYQPRELYFQGHLVSSQMPLAMIRQPDREVSRALGFPEYPPLNLVIKHFDAILAAWSSEDHGGIEEETIARSIGVIYQYFGNLKETPDLVELKTHYAEVECLWHPRKKIFCRPNHVFREAVQYMEPWQTQIVINDNQQDQGYTNLGRLGEPGIEDFVEFLNNLQDEFIELPITDEISRQVVQVLRRLSSALIDNDIDRVFPVLTQASKLVDYTDVYVPDASWFQDKLFKDAIHLLHVEVPGDLIQTVGIRLLSKSIEERIALSPTPSNNPKLQNQCDCLQKLICSKEFISGIVRLIRAEHGYIRTGGLNWLEQTNINAVQAIIVDLWLVKDGTADRKVGSGPANFYFDPDRLTIYLAPQKPTVMYNVLGHAINFQLDDLKLRDTSLLTSILSCQPDEIDEILTQLHVAALPEYPQREFEFEGIDETTEHIGASDDEELSDSESAALEQGKETQEQIEDHIEAGEIKEQDSSAGKQSLPPVMESNSDLLHEGDTQKSEQEEKQTPQDDIQGEQGNGHQLPAEPNIARVAGPRIPTGEDVPPPTEPGSGKSPVEWQKQTDGSGIDISPREPWVGKRPGKRSGSHSRYDRIFTSGVYSHQGQQSELYGTDSQNDEIGNQAVDRVVDYEIRQGYKPKRMPHNNPGYDIEVYAADGQTLLKCIEVKGINGPWGVGGVSISATQYNFGELHSDKFWLYVVEYALDDNAFRIYPIQNPTRHITHYRFDHGWKELAEVESKFEAEPAIGLYVRNKLDQSVGIIVKIKGIGLLKQITVRFENGREERMTFKPNLMELINASGE